MALNKFVQTNFTAGELSPQMYGRSDFAKYYNGARELSGFIPTTVGDLQMRPGSRYVAKAISSSARSYFLEFRFNSDDVYLIELSDGYARFYKDKGQIIESHVISGATWTAGTATFTIPTHTIRVGTEITVSGIDPEGYAGAFDVLAVTGTTVDVSIADDPGTYVSGGTMIAPYEIASPYADYQLIDLKYTQSADILFLSQPEVAFHELRRTSDTSWEFAEFDFQDGPFLAKNTNSRSTMINSASTGTTTIIPYNVAVTGATWTAGVVTLTTVNNNIEVGDTVKVRSVAPTGYNGDYVVTAETATTVEYALADDPGTFSGAGTVSYEAFSADDVGRLVRIKHSTTWGYAKITVFTTEVLVTAEVGQDFSANNQANTDFNLGYFYIGNQPWTCTFHQQRLFLGGCNTHPHAIFASETGDFNKFRQTGTTASVDNDVVDSNGFVFLLDSNDVASVRFLLSARQGLAVGTDSGPWIFGARSEFDPITPTNVSAVKQTPDGANKYTRAFQAGESTVFAQRAGEVIREFAFNFDNGQYRAIDLNQIASHILKNDAIKDMTIQREPDTVLWMATESGELKALTYERAEDVIAWHRQPIGGTDVSVESVGTMRDNTYDLVWLCVKRTVNGSVRRYIEFIEDPWRPSNGVDQAFYVDSGITYSGAPATTISGLEHLNGDEVSVLADGQSLERRTVENGQITLDTAASVVQVGYWINRLVRLMPLVSDGGKFDHRGNMIRPVKFDILVNDSTVFEVGDTENFDEVLLRDEDDNSDTPQDVYSGYIVHPFNFRHKLDPIVEIRQTRPLPLSVAQVIVRYEVGGSTSN